MEGRHCKRKLVDVAEMLAAGTMPGGLGMAAAVASMFLQPYRFRSRYAAAIEQDHDWCHDGPGLSKGTAEPDSGRKHHPDHSHRLPYP